MKISVSDKKRLFAFRKSLLNWHKKNQREFSWRKDSRDPYEVIVCEVMGQQTQASRIEQFLPKFLKRFPTAKSLAAAKKSDVIQAWQGLGYNRRALNLQRTAIELSNRSFPQTEKELLTLPGIGKYTANAVLIFAFNKQIATIDVNIERVLSRVYRRMNNYDAMLPKKELYPLAEAILPKNNSRQWHEALMDFGATICTKRNPRCDECPLFKDCRSHDKFEESAKPVKNIEKKYFGNPKRIWRGKVLSLIADKPFTETQLTTALLNSFSRSDFSQFINDILKELTTEGFCEKKNKTYRLSR